MDKRYIAGLLAGIVGPADLKIDESMSRHTSFKIGGLADILVTQGSDGQIIEIVRLCRSQNIPLTVIGNGSNLIVRDGGIRGVVLKIYDNFSSCKVAGETIEAESGILLSKLVNIVMEHELTGLEFASGIPGTLGGAVVMNAGAYGPEMKDVVIKTRYVTPEGEIRELDNAGHEYGHRKSVFQQNNCIVLSSILQLRKGIKEEIKARMNNLNALRREKQPLSLPSAGSVFRRPEGHFAGKLVEDCGLKGFRIGGAEVSCLHCGFIVNIGCATADDVINLIKYIQKTVKDKFDVVLHTEVKIIGEDFHGVHGG